MFIVQVNDSQGVLKELVHIGVNPQLAATCFLDACKSNISNWDDYGLGDIDDVLDNGFESFGGGTVMLIDTSNCITDDELQDQMAEEVWYVWKERTTVEGEDKQRLLTPWGDPHLHEFPFDFMYATPEEAIAGRKEMEAEGEDWVLCKETLTGIHG